MRGQEWLCFVLALVKCTRIYFSGANDAPCLQAHSKHCSWMVCSILQFSSVDLPKARRSHHQQSRSRGWESRGVADFNEVGVVEEEKDGRQW